MEEEVELWGRWKDIGETVGEADETTILMALNGAHIIYNKSIEAQTNEFLKKQENSQ